jgi:hypothetical protein
MRNNGGRAYGKTGVIYRLRYSAHMGFIHDISFTFTAPIDMPKHPDAKLDSWESKKMRQVPAEDIPEQCHSVAEKMVVMVL